MYYVYCNDQHVRSFNTEREGKQWVESMIASYQRFGARSHPPYKLCYNGTKSVMLHTWPKNPVTV